MRQPRYGHTATLLRDGSVLVTGGIANDGLSLRSAEIYHPAVSVPGLQIADFRFDRSSAGVGTAYSVDISGSNLTPQTFFDIRFSAPGGNGYAVVLNWQRGFVATHNLTVGTASGKWTINGVRPHQDESDHTGDFFPIDAAITVSP